MEADWYKDRVVYQVYPKSFKDTDGDGIGDLRGVIEKIDYIKELGVNTIWLNPIFVSPQVDNGYDIANYYAIDERLGSIEDFDELVMAAHERGIKVILDFVMNHISIHGLKMPVKIKIVYTGIIIYGRRGKMENCLITGHHFLAEVFGQKIRL